MKVFVRFAFKAAVQLRFARNQAARSQESLKLCRFLKISRASCGCLHSRSLIKLDFLGAMENYKRGHGVWGGLIFFLPFLSVLYSILSIRLSGSQLRFFSLFSWSPLVGLFC